MYKSSQTGLPGPQPAASGGGDLGLPGVFSDADGSLSFPRKSSGKLSRAFSPLRLKASRSYAMAASSAVSKVPSQRRVLFLGKRISATHFPQCRCRTPR
nr:hypothetical protein KK1_023134 [Ipomoea trifida]